MTEFATFTIDSPTNPEICGEWYRRDEVDQRLMELGYDIWARDRRIAELEEVEIERLKSALRQIRDWDENGKVFTGMHASAAVRIADAALGEE